MPRPRIRRQLLLVLGFAGAASCASATPKPAAAPEAPAHALSGLARVRVAVLPTYAVRVTPGLSWAGELPSQDALRQTMDADIASAFDDRGLRRAWVFPPELEASYKRNSTYAADPRDLAEEPLRSPSLAIDARLPEPLASQLRTLVALHDDVRLVLAPIELRFEPAGAGAGRAVLRLVLVDARMSNVRWMGEITSDTTSAFGPVITASLGAKLAGVVAAP
ncbi:MAG TPA: hypothetical protein VHB25_16690 [Gemmatimonadaceae bacterium]|nr:hypothetical protein [Gemmatimonadaceae bacterium]